MRTERCTKQPSLRDFCHDSCLRKKSRQNQVVMGHRRRSVTPLAK